MTSLEIMQLPTANSRWRQKNSKTLLNVAGLMSVNQVDLGVGGKAVFLCKAGGRQKIIRDHSHLPNQACQVKPRDSCFRGCCFYSA